MSPRVLSARYLFIAGWLAAFCFPTAARAADVTITIIGTVVSGTDVTGVFGFPLNTPLGGKAYVLTFNFDDTKGTAGQGTSYIESSDTSNPGTAVLQIEGGNNSFSFGMSSDSSSFARLASGGEFNSSYSVGVEDCCLGNGADVQGSVYPAKGTVLTTYTSWEDPFVNTNLYVPPSPTDISNALVFRILEPVFNTPGRSANGYLTADDIIVSGPGVCPLPPLLRGTGRAALECIPISAPNPACPVNVSITVNYVEFYNVLELPANYRPYMRAQFTTLGPTTLGMYAHTCGFNYFAWQQQILIDPGGDTVRPDDPKLVPENIGPMGSLIAPPSFYDPPPGGYAGAFDSYPFFYPLSFLEPGASCVIQLDETISSCPPDSNQLPYVVNQAQNILSFADAAGHDNLSGEPPSKNPTGNFLSFLTTLVGVSDHGTTKCGEGKTYYCTPLFSWTWNTTYSAAKNTGGIKITSINGVTQ